MTKAKNKTIKTEASVEDYIASIAKDDRRADIKALHKMMMDITGWEPKMWGKTIVGFGEYHYKYDSGREGDALRTGYSSRAQNITIYVMPGYEKLDEQLSRLGKHKLGKSCLYIKRLSDVDTEVLREIIQTGVDIMAEKYPLED